MVRIVLFLILFIVIARVFWRVVDNIIEAAGGQPPGRAPQRGVAMARDPVCGTFVVRERALWLGDGDARVFFCSDACRDRYRGQASASAKGRTA
jgi:YHS domain-containing protein